MLKTVADYRNLLDEMEIFDQHASLRWTSDIWMSIPEENQLRIHYRDNHLYSYLKNSIFAPTICQNPKNRFKLTHLNINVYELSLDFFYHWTTNFDELASYANIRAAMQSPDTAASLATTYAFNRYIKENNLTLPQIKALKKGSHWRWSYIEEQGGIWIQTTLWKAKFQDFNRSYPTLSSDYENVFASLKTFEVWFSTKIRNIDRLLDNQPVSLNNYNDKATNYFSFKKSPKKLFTTFLGVELELENFTGGEIKTLNVLEDHAIFKRDGSLTQGVEICTAPATLDIHKEEFEKFFLLHKENHSDLNVTETCGLHVHVDKTTLSSLHIANIHLFINNDRNADFLAKIAGRNPNSYCQKTKRTYGHFTSSSFPENEKYTMLNIGPTNTIEFRLFASTLEKLLFDSRLEFVQALVDYTRPGTSCLPIKEIPKWEHFKEYLSSYKKFFPNLLTQV